VPQRNAPLTHEERLDIKRRYPDIFVSRICRQVCSSSV
jgi:hypothetical protein